MNALAAKVPVAIAPLSSVAPGSEQSSGHRLIVLLGMHRSGTSALTRGLLALGVDLGDQLMPATGDNAKGYWEDTEVVALNDRLLSRFGHSWHTIADIPAPELTCDATADLMLEAVALLRRKLKDGVVFGMKDPRLARVLPFWQAVFAHLGVTASYVIAMRNPISVAASLRRRDGFPAEKSHFLWLGHVLAALRGTAGQARIIVDYDVMMAQPVTQLRRLATALDLPLDPAEATRYAQDFLAPELRHALFEAEDLCLAPAIPPDVTATYAMLRQVASGRVPPETVLLDQAIARLTHAFDTLRPAFHHVGRLDRAVEVLNRQVDEQAHQIATLTQTLSAANAHAQALEHRLVMANDAMAQQAALNQSLAETAVMLTGQLEARAHEMAALNQTLDAARREVDRLAAIENSTIWRATRPLRRVCGTRPSVRRVLRVLTTALTLGLLR
ncbi:hypothetical protein [Azospirillum sp. B4]|uniref:hypothetical protein n=1 Tax=Azospirillum sp. B4 TaxID=95605 RepID=UPI00034B0BF7|nr:hypothetical protein [Azospirillum sp. B4]